MYVLKAFYVFLNGLINHDKPSHVEVHRICQYVTRVRLQSMETSRGDKGTAWRCRFSVQF